MQTHRKLAVLQVILLLIPSSSFGQNRRQEPAAPDLEKAKEQIVSGTNRFRADHDREGLKVNAELSKAAQDFAEFMARTDKYGHTADGKQPSERAEAHHYVYCIVAENIAYQFNSAGFTTKQLSSGFVQGWEDSPPHRKNMLDPDVFDIGVGVAQSSTSGKYYAVQEFGRPKSKEIVFKITNRTGSEVQYDIADKTYKIKPRYTITHRTCRPPELEFQWPDGKKQTYAPASGAALVITRNRQGAFAISKQ
jgi:uncharacterized protein YkwD